MKTSHIWVVLISAMVSICLMGIVRASVVVTQHTGPYTLDGKALPDGTTPKQCIAAASVDIEADARVCQQVNQIVIQRTCDDVPKPDWPADQQELVSPQDGNNFTFWERDYVKPDAPKYPDCWVPGLVPPHTAQTLPSVQEPMYRPALVGGAADGEHP